MQELSYDFYNAKFKLGQFTISVEIFTYENVYYLDPDHTEHHINKHSETIACSSLTWAGGLEKAPGSARIDIHKGDTDYRIGIQADMVKKIRCVKLVVENVPKGKIVNLRSDETSTIPADGMILNYPNGWRELATPVLMIETEGDDHYYLRSTDDQVREKRITLRPQRDTLRVELIWAEDASKQIDSCIVPAWEIGQYKTQEDVFKSQKAHLERTLHLQKWEDRADVPHWARKISLVVALHMQHYTGFIFNDYKKAEEIVNWFAQNHPVDETLFYLPGWEGRYYWQYGDYRPDERLGGREGFVRMVNTILNLGGHVMPMFGMNVVNKTIEGYEQWGFPSRRVSASGNVKEGSVDWDTSRDYDLGWGSMLNPGAPGWQNRLVAQIRDLIHEFGFDSVFLDISAAWWNDPSYHVYEGTNDLIRRIREGHPELLIAGEGWYDGMAVSTPLVQSGHTDGVMHWHDDPYEPIFTDYCRSFAHLSLGDASRGSTGVHELGLNPVWNVPLRKGVIPTATIVDGTLETGQEKLKQILEQAKNYSEQFLK